MTAGALGEVFPRPYGLTPVILPKAPARAVWGSAAGIAMAGRLRRDLHPQVHPRRPRPGRSIRGAVSLRADALPPRGVPEGGQGRSRSRDRRPCDLPRRGSRRHGGPDAHPVARSQHASFSSCDARSRGVARCLRRARSGLAGLSALDAADHAGTLTGQRQLALLPFRGDVVQHVRKTPVCVEMLGDISTHMPLPWRCGHRTIRAGGHSLRHCPADREAGVGRRLWNFLGALVFLLSAARRQPSGGPHGPSRHEGGADANSADRGGCRGAALGRCTCVCGGHPASGVAFRTHEQRTGESP